MVYRRFSKEEKAKRACSAFQHRVPEKWLDVSVTLKQCLLSLKE